MSKRNWKLAVIALSLTAASLPVTVGSTVSPQVEVENKQPDQRDQLIVTPSISQLLSVGPLPLPTPLPTPTASSSPRSVRSGAYLPEIVRCVRGSEINLSFDGGAGAQSIELILTTLSAKKVKGTFFLTGRWVQVNVDASKAIRAGGHEIYNHTWNHTDYNSAGLPAYSDDYVRQQFQLAEQEIVKVTGQTSQPYFRPPYGARNSRVLQLAWDEGFRSVFWTLDALDWQTDQTEESVYNRIAQQVTPGMILMMHIGDDITGQVLGRVIDHVRSRGFSLVPLTQCVST